MSSTSKKTIFISISLILSIILGSGCSNGSRNQQGSGNGILRVRVVDYGDNRVANVTVVLGDSNGSLIAYGATNADGEYLFNNSPKNATVTAVQTCNYAPLEIRHPNSTIVYDVNVPTLTLSIDDCGQPSLGTINVTVTNIPTSASYASVCLGNICSSYSNTNNQMKGGFTIIPQYLQNDGRISLIALAYDSDNNPITYGVLLDQSVSSTMTATISASQIFTNFVEYDVSNIPTSSKSLWGSRSASRNNQTIRLSYGQNLSSTISSTVLYVPYIPEFSDSFVDEIGVSLAPDMDGITGSIRLRAMNVGQISSNQLFDFSQGLSIPANITVSYPTGTERPLISWTGIDTASTFLDCHGMIELASLSNMLVSIKASSERTSIIFPQLPDELAAYRPVGVRNITIGSSSYSMFTIYTAYLSAADQIGFSFYTLAGLSKWSGLLWSAP